MGTTRPKKKFLNWFMERINTLLATNFVDGSIQFSSSVEAVKWL